MECRLAAALIARKLGASAQDAAAVRTLREVEPAIAEKYGPGLEGKVGEAGLLGMAIFSRTKWGPVQLT